eukprot:CAMPEP_0118651868 /NCGR_PEP_ID=MMETSP0785-20121206/11014_1 /TAXON_ID=91992 /ORGANISM="Bolidomonas pacifica, Strain CCMP 1866" /LENGTH=136 /DNA_ID=CAMNT_0006544347 /DNA_START=136 /DNA_END=542 /DNA_ORIENTATION=+
MKITLYWGGELSQGVADQISAQAGQEIAVEIVAMESYGKSDLEAFADTPSTCIFLLQTAENNQPPEDASKFLRFFKRKSHPTDMLSDKLQFAVLGLGDSNLLLDRQTTTAKDCSACGQLLDTRLETLGGTRFYELG